MGSLLRITTTIRRDLDNFYPAVSGSGDRIVWVSDANYAVEATGDYTRANQVWVAKLTFGCSRHQAATNYLAAPDVEECCKWPSVAAASGTDQVSKAAVVLTF